MPNSPAPYSDLMRDPVGELVLPYCPTHHCELKPKREAGEGVFSCPEPGCEFSWSPRRD